MITNSQIAAIFDEIAEMLTLKKDNIFKIRAYRKVARAVEELNEPLEKLVSDNRLHEIPGVGPAITKKIIELVTTGELKYYDKLKKEVSQQPGVVGS